MRPAMNPVKLSRLAVLSLSEDPPDWFIAGVAAVKMSQETFPQDAAWLWKQIREGAAKEDQEMAEDLRKRIDWKTPY
jgi:hypothetical protein